MEVDFAECAVKGRKGWSKPCDREAEWFVRGPGGSDFDLCSHHAQIMDQLFGFSIVTHL